MRGCRDIKYERHIEGRRSNNPEKRRPRGHTFAEVTPGACFFSDDTAAQ